MEECTTACQEQTDCLQYSYHENACTLCTENFSLGEGSDGWHSGWNKDHIAEWIAKQDCGDVKFPFQT
jgi:hypothetical protein